MRRVDVRAQVSLGLEALAAEGAAVAGREVPRLHMPDHVVVLDALHAADGADEVAPAVLADEVLHRGRRPVRTAPLTRASSQDKAA